MGETASPGREVSAEIDQIASKVADIHRKFTANT